MGVACVYAAFICLASSAVLTIPAAAADKKPGKKPEQKVDAGKIENTKNRFAKPIEGPYLDGPILLPGSIIPPDTEIDSRTPPDEAYGAYQRGYYLTALKLALARAETGDTAAQTLVAEIYRKGFGVGRDIKKAAQWYQFAADGNNREAQFLYANLLLRGEGVAADKKLSEKYMRKAADAGHPRAQFNLAQLIIAKRPTWSGYKKALPYYTGAAENGIADAQYALANMYAEARGVPHNDDRKALKWLQRSAQNGFETAQVDLAIWSASGRGTPDGKKNIKAAQFWYTRAAAQGNVIAQNRLARIHAYGLGTKRDVIKGAAWHILAKRAGFTDSKLDRLVQNLSEIDKKRAIEGANQLARQTGS